MQKERKMRKIIVILFLFSRYTLFQSWRKYIPGKKYIIIEKTKLPVNSRYLEPNRFFIIYSRYL